MKYYVIAGEASGDLHGANLMKYIYLEDVNADIRFWGGDLMEATGGYLVSHYKDRAFMGFVEVLVNLRKIFGFISKCKKDIDEFIPDVLIFIDNSGFNLRIAKWAKAHGFKTHYYVAPQVWASRESRVEGIKRDVDALYTILPFEKAFYKKHNYDVHFVGHPLIDAIDGRKQVDEIEFRETYGLGDKKIIALLPGSRKQEIAKMLSVMLLLVDDYLDYQFVVAGAPSQTEAYYKEYIGNTNVKFIPNKTYDLLSISYAALVASGTATLEAALFKVPQVVCYKGSWISYQIAKRIVTLKFISLVNLIMDKEVVTELIQEDFNKDYLKKSLSIILNPKNREKMFLDYFDLEKSLGGKGASEKTAKLIVEAVKIK